MSTYQYCNTHVVWVLTMGDTINPRLLRLTPEVAEETEKLLATRIAARCCDADVRDGGSGTLPGNASFLFVFWRVTTRSAP